MQFTEVYETYWRFAAERQNVFFARLADPVGPWTTDYILNSYRFTNVYRASDRVSQYLIRNVQYPDGSTFTPEDIFFRTILFKLFNKIETWQLLEQHLGPIAYRTTDLNHVSAILSRYKSQGRTIYSAAYILPSPNFGYARKHDNHLALLSKMMDDRLPDRIRQKNSLREVYLGLLDYPSLGPFLAFQFAIDLNYSPLIDFPEESFVVAGPGALDGISKCIADPKRQTPEETILEFYENQTQAFLDLSISFKDLFGRRLMPIDCQNLFCEVSKYARVAHPTHKGIAGRTRIKQQYTRKNRGMPIPFFPPKWGLNDEVRRFNEDITEKNSGMSQRDKGLLPLFEIA